MSSVTKTGPSVYYASWRESAAVAAIHYVFSVATMVWFLSLEPSSKAVVPIEGIDTSLLPSIDFTKSNIDLFGQVLEQGAVRVVNAFARTSDACTTPEGEARAQGALGPRLEKMVHEQQEVAEKGEAVLTASRARLDKLSEDLTEATQRETAARLAAKAQPDNEKVANELTAARSWRRAVESKHKAAETDVKRDVAAEDSSERDVVRTARGAAFTARSCQEAENAREEAQERARLMADLATGGRTASKRKAGSEAAGQQGGAESRSAKRRPGSVPASKAPAAKSRASKASAGKTVAPGAKLAPRKAGRAAGMSSEAGVQETIDAEKTVEMVAQDIAYAEKLVGCDTAFDPTTLPRVQGQFNSVLDLLGKYLKPTTLMNMDRRLLAGEFAGVEFGAAPLRSPPNQAVASIGLVLLRPIIYGILAIIFAGYLAYTMVSIPFAGLMNGIQDAWFAEPDTKMPMWKALLDRFILLACQGTAAFWTIPLWFIFGGSVFWLTALVVMTPVAFGALAQSKRPWHQTMYYAAVAALPLTLITMAIKGAVDLGNLLPEHSEVKTPALWAWGAWLFATTALGTSAMMAESADGSGRWLSRSAWVALLLLVAIPPLAVLAEH